MGMKVLLNEIFEIFMGKIGYFEFGFCFYFLFLMSIFINMGFTLDFLWWNLMGF